MTKVNLTIDGFDIKAEEETSVLEAARMAGIYVPCLCSHPDLPKAEGMEPASAVYQGDVRIENAFPEKRAEGCMLCLVEVEGEDELVRSCATPVMEGMVVRTDTELVKAERRKRLVPILSGHRHACLTCAQQEGCSMTQCSLDVPQNERCCTLFGSCELEAVANFIGILPETPRWVPTDLPVVEKDPLFARDYNLCIGCLRCVRACNDLRGVGALGFVFDKKGKIRVGTLSPTLEESGCRFCTACVEVCPTGALMDKAVRPGKRDDDLVPCRAACPAHIDIPGYIRLIAEGREDEAHAVIREKVPFPGILGRVCTAPCEDACRRGEIDEPIAICALKRFAADNEKGLWKKKTIQRDETGKRVAVVGAGPAGLTAAFYLRRLGHAITMFDAHDRPGGMMRYGIPRFRLPRDLLEREIRKIMGLGIDFMPGTVVGKYFSIEDLKGEGFDAAFLALGAQLSRHIPFEGSDHKDILFGVDFLKRVSIGSSPELKDSVIVIGGGNVAVDAARTAVRLGAERVIMVCLEKRDKMPAGRREIEAALDEGIAIMNRLGPQRLLTAGEKIIGLMLVKCVSVFNEKGLFNPLFGDTAKTIYGERIIIAAGQVPDLSFTGKSRPIEVREGLFVCDEKTLETGLKGVFAGGDLTRSGSIIHAVSAGRTAAESIDRALGGEGVIDEVLFDRDVPEPHIGKIEGFASLARESAPKIIPEKRRCCFDEVCPGLGRDQAIREAKRCLDCDLRLRITRAQFPPEKVTPFTKENVGRCPQGEGVYRLYSEQRNVIAIKGTATIRKSLLGELEQGAHARFFDFEEDRMYSKRESELIVRYLKEHGRMPGGGYSELDDLF